MSHLSHLLPWNTLSETIKYDDRFPNKKICQKVNLADYKKIKYFTKALLTALTNFSLSANYDNDEKLNLLTWDKGLLIGAYGHLGVLTSVLEAYIQLNLLLTDIDKYKNHITPKTWALSCCRGVYDGGHPEFINSKFNELLIYFGESESFEFMGHIIPYDQRTIEFKEFNHKNINKIHEYLKLLFKILYLHMKSGRIDINDRGLITENEILFSITHSFSLNIYEFKNI